MFIAKKKKHTIKNKKMSYSYGKIRTHLFAFFFISFRTVCQSNIMQIATTNLHLQQNWINLIKLSFVRRKFIYSFRQMHSHFAAHQFYMLIHSGNPLLNRPLSSMSPWHRQWNTLKYCWFRWKNELFVENEKKKKNNCLGKNASWK